jgi:hypothetical protein
VVRVSLEQAKIDFVLVNPPQSWLAETQEPADPRNPKLRDLDKRLSKLERERAKPGKERR